MHTPYDGSHKPFTIGLSPLDIETWIDVDQHFEIYLAEKHRLYAQETANVLVAAAGSEMAQQEVLDVLIDHLTKTLPHLPTAMPQSKQNGALAQAGLLVQEDLVIMQKVGDDWRLTAASLCFPSAWNLHEKFDKPMQDIHQPVPGFGPGTRNASLINRMFDNLRVEQPVIRWNWSLYGDAKLYHPASDNKMKNRFGEGKLDGKVVMRLERQTLRKLPKSAAILFTIRIYNDPLEALKLHADGANLVRAIAAQLSAMTPEEQDYKGLTGEIPKLLSRFDELVSP